MATSQAAGILNSDQMETDGFLAPFPVHEKEDEEDFDLDFFENEPMPAEDQDHSVEALRPEQMGKDAVPAGNSKPLIDKDDEITWDSDDEDVVTSPVTTATAAISQNTSQGAVAEPKGAEGALEPNNETVASGTVDAEHKDTVETAGQAAVLPDEDLIDYSSEEEIESQASGRDSVTIRGDHSSAGPTETEDNAGIHLPTPEADGAQGSPHGLDGGSTPQNADGTTAGDGVADDDDGIDVWGDGDELEHGAHESNLDNIVETAAEGPELAGTPSRPFPVLVEWRGEQFELFAADESADPETYFFQDVGLVKKSFKDILKACRAVLGDEIRETDVLHLEMPYFRLEIHEDHVDCENTILEDCITTYQLLEAGDGNQDPEPFQIQLWTESGFAARLNEFKEAAVDGKSRTQLQEIMSPKWIPFGENDEYRADTDEAYTEGVHMGSGYGSDGQNAAGVPAAQNEYVATELGGSVVAGYDDHTEGNPNYDQFGDEQGVEDQANDGGVGGVGGNNEYHDEFAEYEPTAPSVDQAGYDDEVDATENNEAEDAEDDDHLGAEVDYHENDFAEYGGPTDLTAQGSYEGAANGNKPEGVEHGEIDYDGIDFAEYDETNVPTVEGGSADARQGNKVPTADVKAAVDVDPASPAAVTSAIVGVHGDAVKLTDIFPDGDDITYSSDEEDGDLDTSHAVTHNISAAAMDTPTGAKGTNPGKTEVTPNSAKRPHEDEATEGLEDSPKLKRPRAD